MVGDEHGAMAAFCQAEHARLVGVLAFHVGDRGLAEELAQEALIRACQHWDTVAHKPSPQAWVTAVALNLARSSFRRHLAERRARERHGARPDEAAVVDDDDDRVAVRAAVRALPKRQRAALVLRYYADLPAAEVAAVMGCAEGTVRALTHQAIASLRRTGGLFEERADAR